MCVRLAVSDGRIVATDTAFWMPAAFPPASIGPAESTLRAQLDGLLRGLPKPYIAALAPGEKEWQ